MDELDKKILSILAKRGRISLKNLSKEVCLSSPAVSTRIEKLKDKGYIRDIQAHLDLETVGYPIKAYIHLEMKPVNKPEFYDYIEKIPNVLECCCVTGDYAMIIKVAFKSTKDLDLFIGQLQRFGDTMTQIVFSTAVKPRQIGLDVQKGDF